MKRVVQLLFVSAFWFLGGITLHAAEPASVPTEAALRQLTDQTMLDLHTAITQKNPESLYKKLSERGQGMTTLEQLDGALQEFIIRQLDLAALIKGVAPMYQKPPAVNEDGILVLMGHYPTKQWRVEFNFGYVQEGSQWKPLGFGLEVNPILPAHGKQVPTAAASRQLADQTMRDFADALKTKDFSGLYGTIAAVWRERVTLQQITDAFAPFVKRGIDLTGVRLVAPVFDPVPSIDEYGALLLNGHYPTEPRRTNFHLEYALETNQWKLIRIEVDLEAAPTAKPTMPSEAQLGALLQATLEHLHRSIQTNDFQAFYASIAATWRAQISAQEFAGIFEGFVRQKVSLAGISGTAPTYTERPALDGDGVLSVVGLYPTKPLNLLFRLQYLREDSQWKLVGIKVNIKRDTPPNIPGEAQLRKLTEQAVLDFNAALQAKDFTAFHRTLSATWKAEVTPEQFKSAFSAFIEAGVDFSEVKDIAPAYDEPAAINNNGELVIAGKYPLKSLDLNYRFRFVYDDPAWKLSGIKLSYKER